MKKLVLILTALAVVSATAIGKEVVVAPVVTEEAVVVQPKEKWKATGWADLSYRYYGKDEYGSTSFGKTQLEGVLGFSEKETLEYRVKFYNSYITSAHRREIKLNNDTGRELGSFEDAIQGRLRYQYAYGKVGDSKIDLVHQLEYQNQESIGSDLNSIYGDPDDPALISALGGTYQSLEYRAKFEFTKYMDWTPEWFKNTSAVIEPFYLYGWTDASAGYANQIGFKLGKVYSLPGNFSIEMNLYPSWIESDGDSRLFDLSYEAYLYYESNLYKGEKASLDFLFEGGVDPSEFHQSPSFGGIFSSEDGATISAYAKPSIEFSYMRTEDLKLYLGVSGEYRNWRHFNMNTSRQWDWMPQYYAGATYNF